MMVKVSSPGQIFLFGEHAVVYGQPALLASIDVRIDVEALLLDGSRFEVTSEGVGRMEGKVERINGDWKIRDKTGDVEDLQFVTRASEIVFNYLNRGEGISLSIESDLPSGSGLGSSSAVTTATAAAVSTVLDGELDEEEIIQLAFDAEVDIQGAASRAGVSVATLGGFLKVQDKDFESLEKLSKLDILIGYTGKYANTGELVKHVGNLKESRPNIYGPMVRAIGKTTEIGIEALNEDNLREVGVLMNVNQNLLEGLGVSSPELHDLIEAARDSGAIGAKITGAGGGGCMIALGSGNMNEISNAIEESGGIPIKTEIGVEGLMY
ncbi:hypothetical protein AKJ37_03770 [candidate division MSBL1 archaeon SCGC-AAA259I09]|uniref:Mevalonate kinase n=2 Tax=candidate division MSBL1 TaxID=215777 RepID=A0A133USG9_9EURY|nr:hypothetical protein AKJ62_00625 [candidate division MSBL1 archaeon SCGC-AAA259D14]KXA97087.1 hypothetical protein AKJ37_03770 [candidate division MSBL1 archaeon SCGC-AAA259I09]